MSIKRLVKQVLTEQQNRRYARLLPAKNVTYDRWIREQESVREGKAEVERMTEEIIDSEVELTHEPEFVCFLMPDGQFVKGAINRIAQYFAEYSECVILYGDEDVMEPQGSSEAGTRKSPWFKPDWSPDLFDCSFYFGSMVALCRSLWEKMLQKASLTEIGVEKEEKNSACEIYRIIDVSRFQTFLRCCVTEAGGYRRNSHAIQHIPEILFHGYSEDLWKHFEVQCPAELDEQESCLCAQDGLCVNRLVSVIIPSKDNPDILKKCLEAIRAAAGKLSYEVIIVDNGSSEENKQRIEILVQKCSKKMWVDRTQPCNTCADKVPEQTITYLYRPQEFNFSKMCNMGAEAAKGDLLLFLNDDVELAQVGSLERLAELAVQEYTGAVGIKLYYPNSKRIQHAGITNLPMGPVHKLQFLEDDREYYFAYNRGCRNVLAVTAACLMVEKEKFTQAGGFSEELRVAFNDVDFCFRLYELGYINVCRNDCFAYHHESLSRGDDESAEKLNRLLAERDKLYKRHPGLKGVDPYYNVGLGRTGLDTRIRPAYETAGNEQQQSTGILLQINPAEYRQDNCLLFRVEDSREGMVQGYGVVLGDNNACYDRWLVLQKENQYFSIKIDSQYRPDLIENLPDQTNVGLCGVWIHLTKENLPAGSYRLGMAVRNRVTGLKLINWSNRTLEI